MPKKQRGYWLNLETQVNELNQLGTKLGYTKIEDWYQVNGKHFKQNGLYRLLSIYGGSYYLLLKTLIPSYNWLPWLFVSTPYTIWNDVSTRIDYVNWLFTVLNYNQIEDWYNITKQNFANNYGEGLLSIYNSSPIQLLQNLQPKYNWKFWLFKNKPYRCWESKENILQYLDWLKEKLNYTSMEDWYKVSTKDFEDNYGEGLLARYNECRIKCLQDVYEYNWLPWKFRAVYKGFWNDIKNCKAYMDWLFNELNYSSLEDFYNLPARTIEKYKGGSLLSIYNKSVYKILKACYPEVSWDKKLFTKVGYSDISNKWLSYINDELNITLQSKLTDEGEKCLISETRRYYVDGYINCIDEKQKTKILDKLESFCNVYKHPLSLEIVFEFYGDFWHGNINRYKNNKQIYKPTDVNSFSKRTYQDLYDSTILRENQLKCSYNVVTIWENDWLTYSKTI
jgi:hypothetical protein